MEDLTGKKFGHWTVLGRAEDRICSNGHRDIYWVCQCDCIDQTIKEVCGNTLKRGMSKSCGCEQRKIAGQYHKKFSTYDFESNEYGIGTTTKGDTFYFDKEDYDKIKDICWLKNLRGYLDGQYKGKRYLMYRVIMDVTQKTDFVDHINGNTMDNRKCNLRIVTPKINLMNRTMQPSNTSGVTGVTWFKRDSKWMAQIIVDGKHIHLGYYEKFEDAVKARKEAEEKYYGEYSFDNSRINNDENITQFAVL